MTVPSDHILPTSILVVGGNGMLGNSFKASRVLSPTFVCRRVGFEEALGPNSLVVPDFLDFDHWLRVISEVKPKFIVNCAGGTSKNLSPIELWRANAFLPTVLSKASVVANTPLVHISTDCVFDGRRGQYLSSDLPCPDDLYGVSKWAGELISDSMVIRTSIIGRELSEARTNRGLLDWFLSHPKGAIVYGFTRAFFSGVSTLELVNLLERVIVSGGYQKGVYHYSGSRISKFELLKIFNTVFETKFEVVADNGVVIDRSLVCDSIFTELRGNIDLQWNLMAKDLKEFYDKF